jgi:hypothetical protein
MEIAEERLSLARRVRQSVEIGIQGVRKLAGPAAGTERVSRTVEHRPVVEDEMLPREVTPEGTRGGECQILKVKCSQVPIELPEAAIRSWECLLDTRFDDDAKFLAQDRPAFRVSLPEQIVENARCEGGLWQAWKSMSGDPSLRGNACQRGAVPSLRARGSSAISDAVSSRRVVVFSPHTGQNVMPSVRCAPQILPVRVRFKHSTRLSVGSLTMSPRLQHGPATQSAGRK